jgi:predicted RNase H-like HicB family nuclease
MTVAGSAVADEGKYPEPYLWQSESGKSRAEVIAEMDEAKRLGQFRLGDDGPSFLANVKASKSRAEVVAELEEAQRLGLLSVGDGELPVATAEQEALIAAAGRRAAEQLRVAGRDGE